MDSLRRVRESLCVCMCSRPPSSPPPPTTTPLPLHHQNYQQQPPPPWFPSYTLTPTHPLCPSNTTTNHHRANVQSKTERPVSAAPFGSAAILPISWMYIKMMGEPGLRKATQVRSVRASLRASVRACVPACLRACVGGGIGVVLVHMFVCGYPGAARLANHTTRTPHTLTLTTPQSLGKKKKRWRS